MADVRDTSTDGPPRKLAETVAASIEADILALGWPTGEVVGSEPELLERHGVSRGVLREAIRLVEHKQVARMRRGRGGGLVVCEPDDGPVIDAVAVYVRYADIRLEELFEARKVVEAAATEIAGEALTEDDLARLRADFVDDVDEVEREGLDAHELHRRIGQLTQNPAIELFGNVLTRLTALYVGSLPVSPASRRQNAAASQEDHAAIVDAFLGGNPGLASHRMRRHLDGLEEFLRRRRASQTVLAEMLGSGSASGSKLGEELARTIFRDVAERGWPVGEVLGSEPDLIERYDVSRAVLREAVRLLEYHQIARMRRGPGGGLIVCEPGVDAIADSMTIYLEYRGISPQNLFDVRVALELAAVELAAARLDDDGAARLRACLEHERSDTSADLNEVSHDLHLLIASLGGNRLIALFLRILVRLSARHTPPSTAPRDELAAEVHRTHDAIAEAIIARDGDLARHRMRRHLAALLPWYV